jgi:acyl-CoA thioester hydrolase
MLKSIAKIRVRYAETDKMGVVYHGSYLAWLEVGRTELVRNEGFVYRDMDAAGYHLPVLKLSVDYLKPAFYDDEIEVHTFIRERPGVRLTADYEVRRGDELLATARTVHAFVGDDGQLRRPPPDFLAAMQAHFSESV